MDAREELEYLRKMKRLRELEAKASAPSMYDPTEGMSGMDKFLAGVGKGMTDLARGAGQLTGILSQEDIDEDRRMDEPLMKTGAGKAGSITGTIAAALPAAFIPGANTYAGAALTGAGIGALQPTSEDESRLANIGIGAAAGAGGQAIGRVLGSGFRAGKGLVAPFFKSGQKGVAARTLQAFSGNADEAARNMASARELVPGSVPTAAEVSKDAGIAQLQRSLTNASPQLADDLAQRALDQNAARMAALQGVAGTTEDIASAVSRRAVLGEKLYSKAFSQTVRIDPSLKSLAGRPSMQAAIGRAEKIAEETGKPLGNLFDKQGKFASVRGLHYVKEALDDAIDTAPTSGIGKTELRAIQQTRDELLKWLEKNNPAYNSARIRYAKASRPINRMQVGQEILDRATGSQLRNVRGDFTLTPSQFARAIKADEKVVKAATGRTANRGIEALMTPQQNAALAAIKADLERTAAAQNLGRAVGSNTSQNIVSQDLLRQTIGPLGLPRSFAESSIANTVMRPMQWAMQMPEQGVREQLAKAMLDPKYAAQIIQSSQTNPAIAELVRVMLGSAGPISAGMALQ